MDFLKKFIEGYDEQKAQELMTERDYWQDVVRAEQNKLIVQEPLAGIETHYDVPCAIVYIGDIKGIIPVYEFGINKENHVNTREDLKEKEKVANSYRFLRALSGQKIAFIIKGYDKASGVFTASRKEALEWMKKRTEEELIPGAKTLAVIRNVNPYRAIADIGGVPAILASAEYQHGWTDDLSEHIKVGDHIMVKVLNFDKEKGRAVISRKALIPDPWENLELREKSEYTAEITGVRERGCYFRIKTKNGYVDGFLRHPRHELLSRGDKALVRILDINPEKRTIFGLYLRPLKVN
jgi:ribosomal protein S1